MTMKTYQTQLECGETELRKGHIIRVDGTDGTNIDIGLYKVKGGYAADHVRSGLALKLLDQVSRFGPPVKLSEAKEEVVAWLSETHHYAAVKITALKCKVLNPEFE